MIDNLREEFYDALTPGNSTPITSNQQCHLTQQQDRQNQSTDVANLMNIIQYLKKEVKVLKENKENVDTNKKHIPKKPRRNLKHCWTHACNFTHNGYNCNNPLPDHCERETLDNTMGGSKVGMNYHTPKRNNK